MKLLKRRWDIFVIKLNAKKVKEKKNSNVQKWKDIIKQKGTAEDCRQPKKKEGKNEWTENSLFLLFLEEKNECNKRVLFFLSLRIFLS